MMKNRTKLLLAGGAVAMLALGGLAGLAQATPVPQGEHPRDEEGD